MHGKGVPGNAVIRDGLGRWGRRVGRFALGFLLGWLVFVLLDTWVPFHVKEILSLSTRVLFGLFVLLFGGRRPGRWARRVLVAWVVAGAFGAILLVTFQQRFVQVIPGAGSVILARDRLPACDCPKEMSDIDCVGRATLSNLALCWDQGAIGWNRVAWSVAYLLLVGGVPAFLGLLWVRPGQLRKALSSQEVARTVPLTQSSGPPEVFLSYSRADAEFAQRVAHDLEAHGIDVWWDRWDIDAGDSLPRVIEEAIAGSKWFCIVLSPAALESRWVRTELELARTLEVEEKTVVVPLYYRPCDVPLALRQKAWAEFDKSYDAGLELLLRSLQSPGFNR
jgi:hypothetical protein